MSFLIKIFIAKWENREYFALLCHGGYVSILVIVGVRFQRVFVCVRMTQPRYINIVWMPPLLVLIKQQWAEIEDQEVLINFSS